MKVELQPVIKLHLHHLKFPFIFSFLQTCFFSSFAFDVWQRWDKLPPTPKKPCEVNGEWRLQSLQNDDHFSSFRSV